MKVVYYISPTQANILTPPDAISGQTLVVLTYNGASASYTARAHSRETGRDHRAPCQWLRANFRARPASLADRNQPVTATYNSLATKPGTSIAIQH